MADPTREQRLAALKARRAQSVPEDAPSPTPTSESSTPGPATPTAAAPSNPAPVGQSTPSPGLLVKMRRATLTGATRTATAGASVLSFAAMVVAMGPLTGGGDEATTDTAPTNDTLPTITPPTTQPNVVIEVVPNYVSADGSATPPDQLAAIDETADLSTPGDPDPNATPVSPTPSTVPTQAATPTAVPTQSPAPTAAPAVAPAPTAAPTTAAPPPPTAAPTAPPTTAAPPPPTAAPTAPPTAPPTTAAPPRSSASG